MKNKNKFKKYFIGGLSWTVKVIGAALFLLIAAIFIGEGPPNPFKLTARELFLMISLLVTLAGIVAAFWNQLYGGIAILAGMVPFLGELHQWILYAFIGIGILNIICWLFKRIVNKAGIQLC
jgi:hypothetical protein